MATTSTTGDSAGSSKGIIGFMIGLALIIFALVFIILKNSGGDSITSKQSINVCREISQWQTKTYKLPKGGAILFKDLIVTEYYVFDSDHELVAYDDQEKVPFPWYKTHFDGNCQPRAGTKSIKFVNKKSSDTYIRIGRVPSYNDRYKIPFSKQKNN